MPWVTYKRELPNGTYETVRVWVAPPKKKKRKRPRTNESAAAAAARRRQRERNAALARQRAAQSAAQKARQQRERVERLAAAKARAANLAKVRREAYLALQRRQQELIRNAGIIRDQQRHRQGPTGPNLTSVGAATNAAKQQAAKTAAQKAADAKRASDASAKRWEDYSAAQARAAAIAKFKAGEAKSARELERQLELERQRAAKGGYVNSDFLQEAQKRYEQHASAVYKRYERLVARINAALAKGNIKAARNLYYGKDFAATQREFKYLFGAGKNPLREGSYNKFYKGYQDVALSQREWWKRQMRASLQSQLGGLARSDSPEAERQRALLKAQLDAFNGKTGFYFTHDKNGKRIRKQRTLEEELDYQRALIIMEQQRLATQRAAAEKQRKADMVRHGMTEVNGQVVKRDELDIIRASEDLVKREFAGKVPSFKKAEDLQGFADKLVSDWEKKNPPPPGSYGRGHAGAAFEKWAEQKRAYEQRVYKFFGSKPPEWWERIMQLPGVSHALTGLSLPVSAIGGALRAGNALAFDSSTIGGIDPTIADVPAHVRAAAERFAQAELAKSGGNKQQSDRFLALRRQKYLQDWLASEEGQKWAEEEKKKRRAEDAAEGQAFASGFYGNTDIGEKAQSLINYGSSPTQGDLPNLLFQLLADPTNAVPLKFTTYLARGKYALEAADAAKGLTKPTAKAAAFAKSFLTVDEGTLELRKALTSFEKQFEKSGLSVERAVDKLREETAGLTTKTEFGEAFEKFLRKVGIDPRAIEESQLFNIIEHLATKKADDLGIPHLGQIDEYNAAAKAKIAAGEAAEKAAAEAAQKSASKVKSELGRRTEAGNAARERLAIKRESQEGLLTERSARVTTPEAGAAPVRVTPEPVRNPAVSGASDNRVAARESKKLSTSVRSRPSARYEAADEFFQVDPLGNRLPRDFRPDADYKKLVAAAKAGDEDAAEQLVNVSRYERNRFRMEQEDLPLTVRRRDVRYQPTKFDIADRAGTVGDDVATERLLYDRKIIRELKRNVSRSKAGDDKVRAYVRPLASDKNRHPIIDSDIEGRSAVDEFGDLRAQQIDVVPIGDEIIRAREESLRGVKDLYEPFSHDATKYYEGLSGRDLTTLSKEEFAGILFRLDKESGLATFRDGGQLVFEIFHQLRLAKQWDKLREFSDLVTTGLLNGADTNLMAWMWKAMEERSVLPYSMHFGDVRRGFYLAAEAWGVHPELALAMIPSGYYARRLPLSFGLTARLEGLADNASDLFHMAPKGFSKEAAKDEVTRMFLGGPGEPTRVLHYVAERYGDFFKGGEVTVRMRDELTHAIGLAIGPEAFADIIMHHSDALPRSFLELSDRTGTPVIELIDRAIRDTTRKWGKSTGKPRPTYGDFRDAVEKAYWAGELPHLNGKAHTMMFLARLQQFPDTLSGTLRTYMRYMTKLGGEDLAYAKRLASVLFDGEIMTDVSRVTAEALGRPVARDALSGAPAPAVDRSLHAVFRESGLLPSHSRMLAYAEGRAKKADELEAEFVTQRERDEWLRDGSEPVSSDYMGFVDTSNFEANVRTLVGEMRAATTPGQVAKAANSLEGTLRSYMSKMLDNAAGNMDQTSLDAIRDAVADAMKLPEAKRIILRLQEEMGFGLLGEHLKVAMDTLARQEAELLAELRTLTEAGGAIKQPHVKRAQQINLEIERLRMTRKNFTKRAEFDAHAPIAASGGAFAERPAQVGATRATASQLYEHIFQMSESEWLAFEKQRARRAITSKTTSPARKSLARAHIRDIENAEYAIQVEKQRGVYVPWKERATYREKVIKRHGQTAQELIAPKSVSPFILNAMDAVVEQGRTYWRLLKTAAADDVPSTVKSITHNGQQLDYIPQEVFDEVEQRVANAISEARGYKADTRTRARRRGKAEESERPLGRLSDNDPIVIQAKERALFEYARETGTRISTEAYDEARKVLWKGYVQNRTAKQLLARAQRIVERTGGDLESTFLKLREKLAKEEALRQLGGLAYREMFGHPTEEVINEFVRRYSDDATLRHFTPQLSPFQRRTLEEHVKELSGLDKLDERIGVFLQSANKPPLHNRELTRDFLQRIGAWSPRTAEDFVQGARSWSIWDEAEYWRVNYGEIPEWTNPRELATTFKPIFHDLGLYHEQMKAWGIFNRSQELKLRLEGKTAEEIERAILEGDETLGLKGRRELELQRRYVIERYGNLVSKDGQSLDTMPWLMYPDEYRRYLAKTTGQNLPAGLIQTAKELDEVEALIEKAMEPIWEKYITPKAAEGPITYHDIFKVASEVQAQLLANPKWARRYRDVLGKGLNAWSWLNRALVFSNPSFLVTNIVDAPIKGAYYRFTRRGLFSAELMGKYGDRARALTPGSIGLDATSAMYRVKQASAASRFVNPRGFTAMERAVDRALAVVDGLGHQALPHLAGEVELTMKMHLAQTMYPRVFDEALKRLGDDALADAFAKRFIKKEVLRMWPTAGRGPIEQLWNRFVPFSTYSVRNKILFLSEAAAHPALVNYIQRIGAYIEEQNLRDWEERHPGTDMPEFLRRRIQLPWAPDYYLDLSTFTDASRGLKPLFDLSKRQSVLDYTATWVRVVNPGTQAIVYSLLNAMNVGQRTMYRAKLDANGFPTGDYELVTVGWLEPWSNKEAELGSGFWLAEAMKKANELGVSGWTSGEISQIVGQVFMFNGIATYNKGDVLASFYFNLKEKDPGAAAKWLLDTPEGEVVQDWLMEKSQLPREVIDRLKDIERSGKDRSPWFHDQTPEFQQRVKDARDLIRGIRDTFAAELATLTPGTAEYRELKAKMYMAINNVYLNTPELMTADIFGKTASEFSQQLEDWQTDKLMDDFMELNSQRPSRAKYEDSAAYNKAVEAWNHAKQMYLKMYPQVAARLAAGRNEVASLREQVEKEWDSIFKRISRRNEMIDAAKDILARKGHGTKAGDAAQDELDRLYLQNELDYSLLERDYAAVYFSPDDFEKLPKGVAGPPTLKGDVIKRATVLLDFDRLRYEKAVREGRGAQFLADLKYNQALHDAVLAAKGGDPFGEFDPAKFVQAIKGDSYLSREYFARHPGKKSQWAKTDAYVKSISVWGKLAAAGRWSEANRAWDNLPQWVKDEYFSRHPERRAKRQQAQQTAQYMGYMQRWVSLFENGKKDEAMKYFNSLPQWAKDRYFERHPENRIKFQNNAKFNAQMATYFALDKSAQAKYLKEHPDLAKFLAQNAGSEEAQRIAILQAYRAIPKEEAWLRRVFREMHPEVFSQEVIGEAKLKRVFDTLSSHPDVLPEFEDWVKAIWDTYAEMLLKGQARPLSTYFEVDRKVPRRKYFASLSAEEASRFLN